MSISTMPAGRKLLNHYSWAQRSPWMRPSRWPISIVTAEVEEIEAADVIAGNFLLLNFPDGAQ